MAFKKNQSVILEVVDINHLGFGVAKPDGFVVFIGGTVPGDTVEARIIKVACIYVYWFCRIRIFWYVDRTRRS